MSMSTEFRGTKPWGRGSLAQNGYNAAGNKKKRKASSKEKTATKKTSVKRDTSDNRLPCSECGKPCKTKATLRQRQKETHLGLIAEE